VRRLLVFVCLLLLFASTAHADAGRGTLILGRLYAKDGTAIANSTVRISNAEVTYNTSAWPTTELGQAYWVVSDGTHGARFTVDGIILDAYCITGDRLCKAYIEGNSVRTQWTKGMRLVSVWIWLADSDAPQPDPVIEYYGSYLPFISAGYVLPRRSNR